MRSETTRFFPGWGLVAVGLCVTGCGSGSGSRSTATTEAFSVESISVADGAIWKINRPIDVRFNLDVDFGTVSSNTIQIGDFTGAPATGVFFQPTALGTVNRRVVRFQPTCPTLADFSDAGLEPGGVNYLLRVLGSQSGGVTVRSTSGQGIAEGRSVTFSTPIGDNPLSLFIDTVPGPPGVRVRGTGGVSAADENATYLELGGDPDNRVYFESSGTQGVLPDFFEVPINHYSIVENHVAVVVHFDQSVAPSSANINGQRLSLEYESSPGVFESVNTEAELLVNCSATGAAVRLAPVGLLPQGSNMRVNVRQGFQDLTEIGTILDTVGFANMLTRTTDHPTTADPSRDADEVLESFLVGGDGPDSLEDSLAAFATPHADWGGGKLKASFDFGGSGGPEGEFDWHVPPGTQIVIDTESDEIEGGPGGVVTSSQPVVNGVIDVRDFKLPASSSVTFQGPNACTILATGDVEIRGTISVRGGNNTGVSTLQTAHLPEPGAAGQAGGGSGGTGSFLTSQSTPRGGSGFGAFGQASAGGQGGESSYHPTSKEARRAGGGGGGRFGPDVFHEILVEGETYFLRAQTLIGMDGEPGFAGGADGLGAESQTERARGGALGQAPFTDSTAENDFFGSMLVDPGTPDERLVIGELDTVWAGAGGGGGGDAVMSSSFPLVPFVIDGDEKGSGGGGGGGGIRILALGRIEIVNDGVLNFGRIVADGGHGGGGENTFGFDRVGGGSGGGSGGHIVLSSATSISIGGRAEESGSWYGDDSSDPDHADRPLSALGGQGGAGRQNRGGAKQQGATQWRCDAIPRAAFEGVEDVPPTLGACWSAMSSLLDTGDGFPVNGAGGDGSPGLIQLHVDDPAENLTFPGIYDAVTDLPIIRDAGRTYGVGGFDGLDVSHAMAPPPVGWKAPTVPADHLVPFFGKLSTSQTRWIALGLARVPADPTVSGAQVQLAFDGTEDGKVMRVGSSVDRLDPLVDSAILGDAETSAMPYIEADGLTLVIDSSGFEGGDEIYERNVRLMRMFLIEISGDGGDEAAFTVASAAYDEVAEEIRLTVSSEGGTMQAFVDGLAGEARVSVIPRFFEVSTNDQAGAFPEDTCIAITFDATRADPLGNPNPDLAYSVVTGGFAEDVSELNLTDWDFFRVRVQFDLSVGSTGVDHTTPRPALEFLRVPWEF